MRFNLKVNQSQIHIINLFTKLPQVMIIAFIYKYTNFCNSHFTKKIMDKCIVGILLIFGYLIYLGFL